MRWTIFLFIAAVTYGLHSGWTHRELHQPDGILVPAEPEQTMIPAGSMTPWKYKDSVVEALADYTLRARVLSVANYYLDHGARLAPVDLALGWGPMSDSRVLQKMDVSQNGRFYFYQWKGAPPLEPRQIESHSANVHIIPSNPEILSTVKSLRVGQVITLQGNLVMVSERDGGSWKSSLSRTDSGNGACELMWVTQIRVEP